MGLDVAHSHTLSELQRAILATSALIGPARLRDLVVAVQLGDLSKLEYSELLRIAVRNRTIRVPGSFISSESYHNAFESALKSSLYSENQIEDDIAFLEKMELLSRSSKGFSMPVGSGVEAALGGVIGASFSRFGLRLIHITKEGERLTQAIAAGRVPLVRPPKAKQSTIFFAGAFGRDDIDSLYDHEIEPTCKELGYSTYRVDMQEPFQAITSSILSGIQNAACVLADLTYARPSVYFEAGVAHGLGMPLVLTCRADHLQGTDEQMRIHFDLVQYKTSFWRMEESGKFFWPKRMHPGERLRGILDGPLEAAPPR